jgi:DNA-binding Lrp family transcriptional regulator
MRAFVLVRIRAGEIAEVLRQLRTVPGVVEVRGTFGPYDAIAVLEASDPARLGRTVAMEIQTVPGVTETLTCLDMGL